MPSAFRFVGKPQWALIKANNVKNLAPARQVSAIYKWWEWHLSRDVRFKLETNEQMQEFVSDAAEEMGIDTGKMAFQTALKSLKGTGELWKGKIVNKAGAVIDVDTNALTSSSQIQGKLKEIVADKGRGHHGNTRLGGSHGDYLHWRAGDERIFGAYNLNGTFTLIGVGRHSGSDSGHYKLDLVGGGSTTADTI